VVKLVAPAVIALPGVSQRLERELRQLERVQSSGVARVLASGKRGEETWMAMELLEGAHTLHEAITARGPLAPEQAADLIEVVGEALIEAAQVGVVHRDLAPKNVLFAGQDLKLINFSLPVPTNDKVPGVAEFVSPEQVDGRAVDQRSNLYSLGALYYFVLTGQTVFAGSADEVHGHHQAGAIIPPSQLVPSISAGSPIEALILRALDRSPTKRFLTVRQFVDEVGRVGHGEVIELKPRLQRPKADLVSTLMGVRTKPGGAPDLAKPSVLASAPTVGSGLPSVAAHVAAPPHAAPPPANVMASTMIGVSSGIQHAPAAPAVHAPPIQPAAMHAGHAAPLDLQATAPGHGPSPVAVALQAPSPWASPQQAPAAPVLQAPVVAAPVLQAPVVAAPQVAAQPAGKQRAPEPAQQKGKFRETMWFKKGDLDTSAAVAAAEERARTGNEVDKDKADSLPMDERYKDDGSITRGDKDKYSLRTGATQMMAAITDSSGAGQSMNKVSEDALIGEMKGGRSKVIIGIVVAILAVIVIIAMAAK
jgi:serine/threonine protein kinase